MPFYGKPLHALAASAIIGSLVLRRSTNIIRSQLNRPYCTGKGDDKLLNRFVKRAKMVFVLFLFASIWAASAWAVQGHSNKTRRVKLFKKIDLTAYRGMYPVLGDLNNDGKFDLVLTRNREFTTPGYIVAVDSAGQKLWELGDASVLEKVYKDRHGVAFCRGLCTVYDIDQDGRSEVITELWVDGTPMLYVLDGATGKIEASRKSPFDMSVRDPKGYTYSRAHPLALIARLNGPKHRPAIVMKYEASSCIPCNVFALDSSLNTLWHIKAGVNSMGHIATVADFDNDGRDETVLGHMTVDEKGHVLWEKVFGAHADFTDVTDLVPGGGKEILIAVCVRGPVYCLSSTDGSIIWQQTKTEVPHGQAVWAGNFIEDEPGLEVIVLKSGHVGDFITLRGTDGEVLARFQQKQYDAYPDTPMIVNWISTDVQSLWIPSDRILVDGRGNMVQDLGSYDEQVVNELHPGTREVIDIPTQAFAVDLCGDERDELVLYQPYLGESVLIFTQPDSDTREKPYVHQRNAYNLRSYY